MGEMGGYPLGWLPFVQTENEARVLCEMSAGDKAVPE